MVVMCKFHCILTNVSCVTGCGVNVFNKDPTMCVNDVVRRHNHTNGTTLPDVSMEEMIARTVSKLEELIDVFQCEGMVPFLQLYYRRWLHQYAIFLLFYDQVNIIKIGTIVFLRLIIICYFCGECTYLYLCICTFQRCYGSLGE